MAAVVDGSAWGLFIVDVRDGCLWGSFVIMGELQTLVCVNISGSSAVLLPNSVGFSLQVEQTIKLFEFYAPCWDFQLFFFLIFHSHNNIFVHWKKISSINNRNCHYLQPQILITNTNKTVHAGTEQVHDYFSGGGKHIVNMLVCIFAVKLELCVGMKTHYLICWASTIYTVK